VTDFLFWLFALASVVSAWRVFRTSSMVRAAYWLLASFLGVAGILVLLRADFLGLVLILMMAGEMTIMAVFMVMLMMNPAGLNPMIMVHQHRAAIACGVGAFLGLGAVGVFGEFPDRPAPAASQPTAELGMELLGDSMLVFETAGIALLATMVGAIAIASRRGRFGEADAGSEEPALDLSTNAAAELGDSQGEGAPESGDRTGGMGGRMEEMDHGAHQ
jgi:NADH:ubiquinone oxidoreductase subunit 6 (subunit J)